MAQKGIIKDTVASNQIGSTDFASIFNALLGNISGILNYRNKLEAQIVNDNLIRLKDGVFSLNGHILYVEEETTIDLNIESGTLGMNRIDAIVATYQKNGVNTGTDRLAFEVVRGEPTSGTPSVPELVSGDINATAMKHQELIYLVKIQGSSITSVELNADTFENIFDMKQQVDNAVLDFFGGELVEV